MFKNYLKVSVRSFLRNKTYGLINIIGLTVGIATCLVILLYVKLELSYDGFHENASRIYRVVYSREQQVSSTHTALVQFPVAKNLANEFPQVEKTVRFYPFNSSLLSFREQRFIVENVLMADPSLFEVFTIPFLQGDRATAFLHPRSIVITETLAKKLFGENDPLGETLTFENEHALRVTGVVKDISNSSHLRFDALVNFQFLETTLWNNWDGFDNNWVWSSNWTYLLLSDSQAASPLAVQLPDFVQRHYPESTRDYVALSLQPLEDIHLHSNLEGEMQANGSAVRVYVFLSIAILILLIACVNFMNLSTARAMSRAKEVGMRKVSGASRRNIFKQFMVEAFLYSFISVLLACSLAEFLLPLFGDMVARKLSLSYAEQPTIVAGLIMIGIWVGFLSGSYPAFFLSAFQPIKVLKGTHGPPGSRVSLMQKILVTGQFVISIVLLIGIATVFSQFRYIHDKDLGFSKEEKIIIATQGKLGDKYNEFREELLRNPNVLGVTAATGLPGDVMYNFRFIPEGGSEDAPKPMALLSVDYEFTRTMGIKLVAGRDFSKAFTTDEKEGFILNETAVKKLGWQDAPLGKELTQYQFGGSKTTGRVIGVVKDFHFLSLREQIPPMVLTLGGRNVVVKATGLEVSRTLAYLRETWQAFVPEWPFQYSFVSERLNELYTEEENLGNTMQIFALLAVFVACLGLLGLSSYSTERRTKEIGIRKVLGATVPGIVGLLSKDFVKLVLVANLIAWPVAWFAMNRWLQDFAYRIEMSWWVFALAGGLALVIALLTVSTQAIRAALANPIESLRYE